MNSTKSNRKSSSKSNRASKQKTISERKSSSKSNRASKQKKLSKGKKSSSKINFIKTVNSNLKTDNIGVKLNNNSITFRINTLPPNLKPLVDLVYKKMNQSVKNKYTVNVINGSGFVKDKFISGFTIDEIKYDVSYIYTKRDFDMFSAIVFYDLPNKVELELVTYQKKRKTKKKFGLFIQFEYIETSVTPVKKDVVYLIPHKKYYNFRTKKSLDTKTQVKFLWLSIECDYTTPINN